MIMQGFPLCIYQILLLGERREEVRGDLEEESEFNADRAWRREMLSLQIKAISTHKNFAIISHVCAPWTYINMVAPIKDHYPAPPLRPIRPISDLPPSFLSRKLFYGYLLPPTSAPTCQILRRQPYVLPPEQKAKKESVKTLAAGYVPGARAGQEIMGPVPTSHS